MSVYYCGSCFIYYWDIVQYTCIIYFICTCTYAYIYIYFFLLFVCLIYEFGHYFEPDFCLVFIPNPSIFPESGLNLRSSPCRWSPRSGAMGGKQRLSDTRYSVLGNGDEDGRTQTTLDRGFIHSCPAAVPLISNNPLKLILCSAPHPVSLVGQVFLSLRDSVYHQIIISRLTLV